MTEVYWQAKLWGLLHDPVFKPLHSNSGRGGNSFWRDLPPLQTWHENGWNPEDSQKTIFQHIRLADFISSASDRAAIGSLTAAVNYNQTGLEISHLLSGAKYQFQLNTEQHQQLLNNNRKDVLDQAEARLQSLIPDSILEASAYDLAGSKRLFWWLWRCLPEAASTVLGDQRLAILPAETRLPDSSIWSHASLTSALAGALAGFDITPEQLETNWSPSQTLSHPYLAVFSFSPIQELIKASRKMRDFWAGSWLLHYLSATVSWKLAQQYGPDCLLYPSLYQQPLIDHWLLQQYPEFGDWVKQPRDRSLLTAGFPNVIVAILPKDRVAPAMQTAKSALIETWRNLGKETLDFLQTQRHWQRNLSFKSSTWQGWLDGQWQFYWSGVPIGRENEPLKNAAIPKEKKEELNRWSNSENQAYGIENKQEINLFQQAELDFLRKAYEYREEKWGRKFSINVGSWWASIFDQTRLSLAVTKNARTWEIPTAFGPRSTISGVGPVVHSGDDWITEGETQHYWQRQAGLFDGREELNATETVKRTLEKILPNLLGGNANPVISYPDLTSGVAGYLKTHDQQHQAKFDRACEDILNQFTWAQNVIDDMANKWGIPYIDDDSNAKQYHPRLLNAGWLVEDAETEELTKLEQDYNKESDPQIAQQLASDITQLKTQYRQQVETVINKHYPNNNPASWYVLAAGDGDGMSEWLKGTKLQPYQDYVSSNLNVSKAVKQEYDQFLQMRKRMGPSTHNALSRALLDFSNQLVPYLTEQRYAGRLIYSGGDDVLAYSNLWEWDQWLWDVRQCFRGDKDPQNEFDNTGDYWQWQKTSENSLLRDRPLFTMGQLATLSFGITLAHHSVPLAITLENLWEAESEAKAHEDANGKTKDAVQVRVLYGNGNILKATAKFSVFHQWQQLLKDYPDLESSLYEQAATLWNQHPIPTREAIDPWVSLFVSRRESLNTPELQANFQQSFSQFLDTLWQHHPEAKLEEAVTNWLKLAAFVQRSRTIKL